MVSRWLRTVLTSPLLVLLLVTACGSDATDSPAAQSPPQAPPTDAAADERLFLLDSDGLWELDADDRILVAEEPAKSFLFDASVSRDGTDVALAVQGEPVQTQASVDFGIDLLISEDGGPPRELIKHQRIGEVMSRPNWLPGGEELLIAILGRDESGAADLRIERVDVATGARQRFIESAIEPALSPDASTLAYIAIDPVSGYEVITLMDLSAGESRPLLPPEQVMVNAGGIAWSPDGQRLAFASADPLSLVAPGGRAGAAAVHPTLQDVWVANADGSGLERLTELADSGLSIAWAADSRHLYALGGTGFWYIDADSGEQETRGEGIIGGRVQTLFPN